jgi:hypothetical protein
MARKRAEVYEAQSQRVNREGSLFPRKTAGFTGIRRRAAQLEFAYAYRRVNAATAST